LTENENVAEEVDIFKPAAEQKEDLEETEVDDKFKRLNLFFEQDKVRYLHFLSFLFTKFHQFYRSIRLTWLSAKNIYGHSVIKF
jgi:hypothetical protein